VLTNPAPAKDAIKRAITPPSNKAAISAKVNVMFQQVSRGDTNAALTRLACVCYRQLLIATTVESSITCKTRCKTRARRTTDAHLLRASAVLGNIPSPNQDHIMRINVSSAIASSTFSIAALIATAAASAAPIAFTDQARLQQRDVMTAAGVSYQSSAPIGSSDRARALAAVHASTVQHQSSRSAVRVPGSTDEARALSAASLGVARTSSFEMNSPAA